MTKRTEEIIDGLLSLSDRVFSQEEWLADQAEEQAGNVAIIEVYDLEGTVSKKLKLRRTFKSWNGGGPPPPN